MTRVDEKRKRYCDALNDIGEGGWLRENLHRVPDRPRHKGLEDGGDQLALATQRAALYHTVVEALVKNHGITDDDPERAVVKALEEVASMSDLIDNQKRHNRSKELHEGVKR